MRFWLSFRQRIARNRLLFTLLCRSLGSCGSGDAGYRDHHIALNAVDGGTIRIVGKSNKGA